MSTVIRIQARNNSDAVKMGSGRIRIPGASKQTHNGGKTVIITTDAIDTTRAWLDDAHEVASYEVQS
jgi:hypothetical protein